MLLNWLLDSHTQVNATIQKTCLSSLICHFLIIVSSSINFEASKWSDDGLLPLNSFVYCTHENNLNIYHLFTHNLQSTGSESYLMGRTLSKSFKLRFFHFLTLSFPFIKTFCTSVIYQHKHRHRHLQFQSYKFLWRCFISSSQLATGQLSQWGVWLIRLLPRSVLVQINLTLCHGEVVNSQSCQMTSVSSNHH